MCPDPFLRQVLVLPATTRNASSTAACHKSSAQITCVSKACRQGKCGRHSTCTLVTCDIRSCWFSVATVGAARSFEGPAFTGAAQVLACIGQPNGLQPHPHHLAARPPAASTLPLATAAQPPTLTQLSFPHQPCPKLSPVSLNLHLFSIFVLWISCPVCGCLTLHA